MSAACVPSAADIRAAHRRIGSQIIETPFLASHTLSAITGCRIFLKFENLQFTASFKERGAANRLMTLSPQATERGVIAVSAGNHAQGVAFHAQRLGIKATIVMPRYTPFVKVENTERFGAKVVLEGDSLAEARDTMATLAAEQQLTVVHPYDDPAVIAGQGTIGLEMLAAQPELDTLVVSVGGGGLISGISIAARDINPNIEMVGVQAERFPAAFLAWQQVHGQSGTPQSPIGGPTLAEGIAVEHPGELTQPIINTLDHMALVNEADIEQAAMMLLDIEKTVVEGAAAAGLAAVLKEPERYKGKKVGLLITGGNIDMLTLSDIVRRQLARSHRLARMSITAPDSPGSLATIAKVVGEQGANIEEVSHQRAFADLPARFARIELVLSTRGDAHIKRVVDALEREDFVAELGHVAGSNSALKTVTKP